MDLQLPTRKWLLSKVVGEKAEFRDTLGHGPVAHWHFITAVWHFTKISHSWAKLWSVCHSPGSQEFAQLLKTGPWEGHCKALHKYTIRVPSKTYMNFSRQLDPTLKVWPQKKCLFFTTSQTLKRKQGYPNTHNWRNLPISSLVLE